MVDSVSVSVGGEVAAGVTDVVVVDESGGEREQAQRDEGAEAFDGACAVVFEGELALARPEPRFDPLAHGAERSVAVRPTCGRVSGSARRARPCAPRTRRRRTLCRP